MKMIYDDEGVGISVSLHEQTFQAGEFASRCKMIAQERRVEALNLSFLNPNCDPETFSQQVRDILLNCPVRKLDLRAHDLKNQNDDTSWVQGLMEGLRQNQTLEYLDVGNNQLSMASLRQVAEALSHNQSLRALCFHPGFNPIYPPQDEHFVALYDNLLGNHPDLRSVQIQSANPLQHAILIPLLKKCEKLESLKRLVLSHISSDCTEAALSMIQAKTSLKSLNLELELYDLSMLEIICNFLKADRSHAFKHLEITLTLNSTYTPKEQATIIAALANAIKVCPAKDLSLNFYDENRNPYYTMSSHGLDYLGVPNVRQLKQAVRENPHLCETFQNMISKKLYTRFHFAFGLCRPGLGMQPELSKENSPQGSHAEHTELASTAYRRK